MTQDYQVSLDYAESKDDSDLLRSYRKEFYLPKTERGDPIIYLAGNSLGLQPTRAASYVTEELEDWQKLGVEGHFHARHPWMPYHEFVTEQMASLVGAKPSEVVVMNSLTVNLHLLLISFYRPTRDRYKILIEGDAFPSDKYAVDSQVQFHGYDPDDAVIRLRPREGEVTIRTEDLVQTIETHGHEIATIMLGGVNYYTGQLFDLQRVVSAGHERGCVVGFDLAHAAGNVSLRLHDWDVDFAAWCTYKYLNSGPGGIASIFVHSKYDNDDSLPRFAGWWGHDKSNRFKMPDKFVPVDGAEGWQLSNPPILQLATLRASLDVFSEAGMPALVAKSSDLTGYFEFLMNQIQQVEVITPADPAQRGCQLSLRVASGGRSVFEKLQSNGVVCDWREPDVIRAAPVPLYNSFTDVFRFYEKLSDIVAA